MMNQQRAQQQQSQEKTYSDTKPWTQLSADVVSSGDGMNNFNDKIIVNNNINSNHILPYLSLLSKRASGALPTTARWLRNFVTSHPQYVHNNRGEVTPAISNDLLAVCEDIGMGRIQCPELYGEDTPLGQQQDQQQLHQRVPNFDCVEEIDLVFPKFPAISTTSCISSGTDVAPSLMRKDPCVATNRELVCINGTNKSNGVHCC